MATNSKPFGLVRWIVDESVTVMPLSTLKKGYEAVVGNVVEMKFGRIYYEAEILRISGEVS